MLENEKSAAIYRVEEIPASLRRRDEKSIILCTRVDLSLWKALKRDCWSLFRRTKDTMITTMITRMTDDDDDDDNI